jgi:hypothetical protein
MTFPVTPLKILGACFAVAALVATAMSGSESAGLKGARKLQPLGLSPADAVNSIIADSFGIITTINPPPFVPAEVNSITANSVGIIATLNPPPVVPVNPATTATDTVLSQAAEIFKGLNP